MEESVLLHRLESRIPGHKTQALDDLFGISKKSKKGLKFSNKLSLFSLFKGILLEEDLLLRTKCTKLICELLPKLGADMSTCMSFVTPSILANMAANNLVLKRESIKLVRCFAEITEDRSSLLRSIIWDGIDNPELAVAREVILALDKLIINVIQTDDCYNVVNALCKKFYLEQEKKTRKAIRSSFSSITGIIGLSQMEDIVTQLPSAALSSGKELLQTYKLTDRPKIASYKSSCKLEVDSAISVEVKLLWDLIPESTLNKLHGDDVVEQFKAIAQLESAIRRVKRPGDYLICLDEICEAIVKVIPINNFKVFKASTMLVSAFVEVFSEVLGECVYPLTTVLCRKIGDNKIAVREGTMKCLILLMKACGPSPVLDVVLQSLKDRNPRVREEAINVLIKTITSFPVQDLNVSTLVESLAPALIDSKHRVCSAALDAIAALKESTREEAIIYRAVEKIDFPDKRYFHAIFNRFDQGSFTDLSEVGLHGERCFSRSGPPSRMSNHSVSVPTTSQERLLSKDPTMCPATPLTLPRRYYSAGRNRLPWEEGSRQNTLIFHKEERSEPRPHVFIKGGGARSDGGSYAQMHLKKMQNKEAHAQQENDAPSYRSNTLGSLKKYFPSVKGSPDSKRSWPIMKGQEDEVASTAPVKGDDSYGVQTSSMYESYRVHSGESSGMGTMTHSTPIGSASQAPRQTTLNDSGIFEEHSFVSKPGGEDYHRQNARREILQEEMRREEERLELAKWEKIRAEELVKEEKRRIEMRARLTKENDIIEQERKGDSRKESSHRLGNGYVELKSQNIAKKKHKQALEETSRKVRPRLIKARARTESLNEPDAVPDIDIVGRGLTSNHINDTPKEDKQKDKQKVNSEKTPALRAPSGVYGQRVQPSRSPESCDSSLSDDDDCDDGEHRLNRDSHGSGLSAATRVRFENKRAQYAERQSGEYGPDSPEKQGSKSRRQRSKPVSAPVESRADLPPKRSSSKTNVRANSLRPHAVDMEGEVLNSCLFDEKIEIPLVNPEMAISEAVRNIRQGGEEWNLKIQGLHILRRAARHHPDTFQLDLLSYLRLTCGEVSNLRSTVSRLAIQVIGDYFASLNTLMDADIDRTCETLLTKTAEPNQFIRNDILSTLGKMVENASPSRALLALVNSGATHRNSTVRSVTASCFKDVVERIGVNRCLTLKDIASKFLTAVERFSHDGNQETRYYGRLVLSWCMENNNNLEALSQRHLTATAARNLRDMCEKLQSKGVGSLPESSERTSGRYRSQPVSRAQSNLSATYPGSRSRKPSQESVVESVSPRLSRRTGPRRDVREVVTDKMPPSLYAKLNSSNWQDRHAGIGELLELCVKHTMEVRQCIVRVSDAFTPRLKDPNSKVNLYALQSLLRMLPYLEDSLDAVLTPITEQLVPNLASQRANIVTLTSQILDGFRIHVDNPQLMCEYGRIVRSQTNPRIKPIIIDKISDMIIDVHEVRPKLTEQIAVPILIDNYEYLQQNAGGIGAYVGRLANLLHQLMGTKLMAEVNRIKPVTAATIQEYLDNNT